MSKLKRNADEIKTNGTKNSVVDSKGMTNLRTLTGRTSALFVLATRFFFSSRHDEGQAKKRGSSSAQLPSSD